MGTTIGFIKKDTRSLDNGSHVLKTSLSNSNARPSKRKTLILKPCTLNPRFLKVPE